MWNLFITCLYQLMKVWDCFWLKDFRNRAASGHKWHFINMVALLNFQFIITLYKELYRQLSEALNNSFYSQRFVSIFFTGQDISSDGLAFCCLSLLN